MLTCPFCGVDDFDAIGLKYHLLSGHCDSFVNVEAIRETVRDVTGSDRFYDSNGSTGLDDGPPNSILRHDD